MYLPKSKYTVKHAAWGIFKLKDSPEGEFYVGPYIEDYLGRFYAGKDFAIAQKRPLEKLTEEQVKKVKVKINLMPTEENYRNGGYFRYFRQNKLSKVCEEIAESQMEDEGPYRTYRIFWLLVGHLDNYLSGGYTVRGIRYWNSEALLKLDLAIPGIVEALELKPEEFVEEIK